MKKYIKHSIIFTILSLSLSCAGDNRQPETIPSQCSTDTQCSNNQICQNNICVAPTAPTTPTPPPTTPISDADLSTYQNCEYFGYASTETTDNICADGIQLSSLTNSKHSYNNNPTNGLKNLSAFMQIAEAKYLLKQSNNNANINGKDISLAVLGTGVDNIHNNVSARVNYGNITASTDPNNIHSKINSQKTTGLIQNTPVFTSELQITDTDIISTSDEDLGQGTSLASVISSKNNNISAAIANESKIVSIKTLFNYQKHISRFSNQEADDYLAELKEFNENNLEKNFGDPCRENGLPIEDCGYYTEKIKIEIFENNVKETLDRIKSIVPENYSSSKKVIQDNNNETLKNALSDAKTKAQIILFNNQNRSINNETAHNHLYIPINTTYLEGLTIENRSFNDQALSQKIKNELNDTNNIYITPVANTQISDLIKVGNSSGAEYKTLFGTADANVTNYETSSINDEYGIKEINKITINGFKNSISCSGIRGDRCLIAPSNAFVLDKNNQYVNTEGNDNFNKEYTGSAYIAGIVTMIKGAYSDLSNEDIVAKLLGTAIAPENIDGCNGDDCGAGMVNVYKFVKAETSAGRMVYSSAGQNISLVNSKISLSPVFGNSFAQNSQATLAKAVFFDDYNFTYNAKLAGTITNSNNIGLQISPFLDTDRKTVNENVDYKNISFNIVSTSKIKKDKIKTSLDDEEKSKITLSNFSFSNELGKDVSYKLAFDSNYSNDIINASGLMRLNSSYLRVTSNNEKGISYLSARKEFDKISSAIDSVIIKNGDSINNITSFLYKKKNNKLALSYGLLKEDNSILGSKFSGAFGENNKAITHYINLQISKNIAKLKLSASMSNGITKANIDNKSIIDNISDLHSQELYFSAEKNLVNSNSILGLNYGEPLRITKGKAKITVPVSRNSNSSINYATDNISLKTKGKQRNYELFIKKAFIESNMSLHFTYTTDLNHIRNSFARGLLFKFNKKF